MIHGKRQFQHKSSSLIKGWRPPHPGCLCSIPEVHTSRLQVWSATLAILTAVTLAALRLEKLAFLLSAARATLGNALIYVYPALMFRGAVRGLGEKAGPGMASGRSKHESVLVRRLWWRTREIETRQICIPLFCVRCQKKNKKATRVRKRSPRHIRQTRMC